MIGRGDGDGVNVFVFEQFANIDVGFWLWQTQLFRVPDALVQHALINIAQSGNLRSRDMGKAMQVVVAAASQSANGHAHTIVRAQDSCVAGCRGAQGRSSDAGASEFQEFTPRSA